MRQVVPFLAYFTYFAPVSVQILGQSYFSVHFHISLQSLLRTATRATTTQFPTFLVFVNTFFLVHIFSRSPFFLFPSSCMTLVPPLNPPTLCWAAVLLTTTALTWSSFPLVAKGAAVTGRGALSAACVKKALRIRSAINVSM